MRSIRDIIRSLNETIELPSGSEINGVAELVSRDDHTLPEINGKFVGIDDIYPVRIYHRLIAMTTRLDAKQGYGNNAGATINTYGVAMIIFLQHERSGLYPDELLLSIQQVFPERLKLVPFIDIRITINNAQLDSQTTWLQEYKGAVDYRLKSDQFLFRINYTIETIFTKGCLKECP